MHIQLRRNELNSRGFGRLTFQGMTGFPAVSWFDMLQPFHDVHVIPKVRFDYLTRNDRKPEQRNNKYRMHFDYELQLDRINQEFFPAPYDPFEDITRPEYALGLPERMGLRYDYDDDRTHEEILFDNALINRANEADLAEDDRMARLDTTEEYECPDCARDGCCTCDICKKCGATIIDDQCNCTRLNDPFEDMDDGPDVGDISDEDRYERETRQIERNEAMGMYDGPEGKDD